MKHAFKLHPNWQRFTGHCQITYTTKNQNNQTIVYCLQDNGEKFRWALQPIFKTKKHRA